jgi:hypothetical protein
MNETLNKTECYICMELCNDQSPCLCATCVHQECLAKYVDMSGHRTCTICLGEFEIVNPTVQSKQLLLIVFFLVGLVISGALITYLVGGQ